MRCGNTSACDTTFCYYTPTHAGEGAHSTHHGSPQKRHPCAGHRLNGLEETVHAPHTT